VEKELYNKILRLDENEISITEKGRLEVPGFKLICEGRFYESIGVPKKCKGCLWFKNRYYLMNFSLLTNYHYHKLELPRPNERCINYEPTELETWELGEVDMRPQEIYEKILPDIVSLYYVKRKWMT
jgi:hypothetical protein